MISHTGFAIQARTITSAKLVSLSFTNVELGEILKSIQSQTGLAFFYSNNLLNEQQKRTIKVNNVPVDQALSLLLDAKRFSWRIDENTRSIRIAGRESKVAAITPLSVDSTIKNSLTGRVTDATGHPLIGATLRIKGTNLGAQADASGKFEIRDVPSDAILQVSFTGYQHQDLYLGGRQIIDVVLTGSANDLSEVEVVSTGYQKLPKERATGSFAFVNNQLLNRSVSTDVLSRLDGVTSGVIFNKQANRVGGDPNSGGDPNISIRGRSTLFANTQPLIILDNFPYEGDPANINPNDIESITVLKDAAAASIWGVRAANGVIVLTSKKGRSNQKAKISFNTNVNMIDKPDIFTVPQLTSKESIELETYFFKKGKYNVLLNFLPYFVQTPVVDILDKEKKGLISHTEAEAQLNRLGNNDYRSDYSKYFLRKALDQQYALSINGGGENNLYYISGGFDKKLASQIPNDYNRFTLNARNTILFLEKRLEFTSELLFAKSKTESNPNSFTATSPYEELVDENGKALSVIRDWRQASKDALDNKGLLDWNYFPYDERLNKGNKTDMTDYRINVGLNYKILKDIFSLGVNYQYQQGNIDQSVYNDQNTYATRLLINQYSQIDPSGNITYAIPLGGILTSTNTIYKSNTGRIQLNYNQIFSGKHEITALSGFEMKDYNAFSMTNQVYGYKPDNATSIPVDFFKDFTPQIGRGTVRIPNVYGQNGSSDRFISYYANASYSYNYKYTISASARRDESNLFGVDANQKGVPLYSFGLSWDISKETFYKINFLPYLRLRVTDGYSGNLSKSLSAYTTAKTQDVNRYNSPQQSIINPPNPQLSWEKVHVTNIGIDFATKGNRLSGSIELYSKKGLNLIGNSPIAAQTGVIQFTGNTADMITRGVDFTLNSINTKGKLVWTTNFLLSIVRDKVTSYKLQTGVNDYYVTQNYDNPIVGRPYSAILTYPWAGLDSMGDPQGYLGGKVTKDYNGVLNSTDLADLKFMGAGTPTVFGSLRNNFAFKGVDFSFNIIYKLGYYFRRGSFLNSGSTFRQADYEKRWQKAGDEHTTIVPALKYPIDNQRDLFFRGSEALVEKGDHVRLQDLQAGYSFKVHLGKYAATNLRIYGYVSNLGIIWRANKLDLDPDFTGNWSYLVPNPRSYAIGINVNL
ncbi:SusC/RagA family TonB-linked outer membrane protein [Chitinophaga sp. CC14]|uniref:SusC/RagA family TonB-linked outer membrane protein n=1 Tax=Chitinophaga sp. CC14 TaxID=3029199 RepID=UPI003B7BB073